MDIKIRKTTIEWQEEIKNIGLLMGKKLQKPCQQNIPEVIQKAQISARVQKNNAAKQKEYLHSF